MGPVSGYKAKKIVNPMNKENSVQNEIKDPKVAAVFEAYPENIRGKLMYLRKLILDTAVLAGVGEIEETLKWGEPSYLTPETKSGSTIRIDWKESKKDQYAMYFTCTANLVDAFRVRYPTELKYETNRSIIFNIDDEVPVKELTNCIALALTYHLNKKLEPSARWEMVEKLTK